MKTKTCIAAAVLATLLSACGNKEKAGDSDNQFLKFETYSYDVVAEQTTPDSIGIEGSRYSRITGSGVLPVEMQGADITELRDSLMKLGAVQFTAPGAGEPVFEKGWQTTPLDPESTNACSYSSNHISIVLTTPELVVWRNDIAFYNCGAAHGMYATSFINYSLKSHRILHLSDLMEKGYRPKLTALLREKLKDNTELIVPLDSIGIPSQWRITAYGLRFIYSLYEIAPYSAGEVRVDLDACELADLLTEKAMAFIVTASPE